MTPLEDREVVAKQCKRCKATKSANDFYRSTLIPKPCIWCCRSDAQARRARMAPLEDRVVVAKECKRCKATKSANDFYRNKLMADGLYSHCKVRLRSLAQVANPGQHPTRLRPHVRCVD